MTINQKINVQQCVDETLLMANRYGERRDAQQPPHMHYHPGWVHAYYEYEQSVFENQ